MSSPLSKVLTPVGRPRPERVVHKRNAEERARLLARYKRSGQTQQRFCRENGLSLSTLQYWLHQHSGRSPAIVENGFVQVPPPVAAVCMPAVAEPAMGTVQIRLPSQIELHVGVGADPAWVGALLQGVLTCSA
jgi:lambda repressor-like predicted transcriptional regulator